MRTIRFSMFAALVAMFLLSSVSVFAKGGTSVWIGFAKNEFAASDAVVVSVEITNNSRGAVRLLKWYTPVDGLEEPLFTVKRDGEEVEFIGPHYKRPAATPEDFIVLKPGATVRASVNLADYYDFSATGEYTVSFDVDAARLSGGPAGSDLGVVASAEKNVYVEGRAVKAPAAPVPTAVSGSSAFAGRCTTSQQGDILTARTNAAGYASDALSYLMTGAAGARYTTWFGAYNASRYSTVTNHFSAIKGALETASMTFDCGCKKKYYAYVYPNQPYTIYLCSVFWTAPATGTDSKAGTLVHETSHFTVVAGTDDWAYGQSAAKSLAISDPAKAIDNADSHEYFGENTPALP